MKIIWIWILLTIPFLWGCEKEQPSTAPQETREVEKSSPGSTDEKQPEKSQEETSGGGHDLEVGQSVYQNSCASCHDQGIAGAPATGNREAWSPRIDKGMDVLVKNSIDGFQGNQGVMPPKGGNPDLTDEEVAAAVAYMVEQSR